MRLCNRRSFIINLLSEMYRNPGLSLVELSASIEVAKTSVNRVIILLKKYHLIEDNHDHILTEIGSNKVVFLNPLVQSEAAFGSTADNEIT